MLSAVVTLGVLQHADTSRDFLDRRVKVTGPF